MLICPSASAHAAELTRSARQWICTGSSYGSAALVNCSASSSKPWTASAAAAATCCVFPKTTWPLWPLETSNMIVSIKPAYLDREQTAAFMAMSESTCSVWCERGNSQSRGSFRGSGPAGCYVKWRSGQSCAPSPNYPLRRTQGNAAPCANRPRSLGQLSASARNHLVSTAP